MNEPIFTFVVPTLNRPSLGYAVESILNQKRQNWDLIICGDGVTPPSFNDPRIKTISIPKANATKAREAALRFVRTPWCVLVDDDDWVTPDYLNHFERFVDTSDVIISQMMNYGVAIPDGHFIQHERVGISFAVRTAVWRQNPMLDPPTEDYYFLSDLENKKYKIAYTDYCGYYVRKFQLENVAGEA